MFTLVEYKFVNRYPNYQFITKPLCILEQSEMTYMKKIIYACCISNYHMLLI